MLLPIEPLLLSCSCSSGASLSTCVYLSLPMPFYRQAANEANTKAKLEALKKRALKAEKAAAKAAEFGALVEEAGTHAASAQAAWQSERNAMTQRSDEERQVGVSFYACAPFSAFGNNIGLAFRLCVPSPALCFSRFMFLHNLWFPHMHCSCTCPLLYLLPSSGPAADSQGLIRASSQRHDRSFGARRALTRGRG